ncbi:hypothetical protein IDH44_17565 [Paenibacillus sp. IB182496]|uniref:ABC transporter substrate-binding protein n=1 Tax=Paenibacillus sabuli TaxID=2772509 RepID=A0A927BWY1_9BACL|nr:hypothetical protein [Paenibacillus sabuli]MBD2847009.1 hypothetical protein [Paenibacillus sabuli]
MTTTTHRRTTKTAIVLMLVLALLAACSGNEGGDNNATGGVNNGEETNAGAGASNEGGGGAEGEASATIPVDTRDSSELPDWDGKELSLRVWFNQGTGGSFAGARKYTDDLVSDEIARVTGVRLDLENSFDNGGSTTGEVKLGMIAASNDWPDIIINGNELNTLADNDKIYDLTELIPTYMPNLSAKLPPSVESVWSKPYISRDGKIYGIPAGIYNSALPQLYEDIDPAKFPQTSPYGYIFVRDDVLKQIYPDAKSQAEIEALYEKNGQFTKDEVLDVPIRSEDEFFEFLYKLNELAVTENNKQVPVMYLSAGQDNWGLLTTLSGALSGSYSPNGENNYFTYWDKETGRIEWRFLQEEFKERVLRFNKLLRDGVASKEAMVDPYNVFTEKLNNGEYLVAYQNTPDNNMLEQAGKPYRYRKVYLDIPFNYDKYVLPTNFPDTGSRIYIVKDAVSEEDLPQVLRWLDYQLSDAGEKLWYWGPADAGLFTEDADGQRSYTDPELEAQLAYGEAGKKAQEYGLWVNDNSSDDRIHTGLITFMPKGRFDPLNWYPHEKFSPKNATTNFDMARVGTYETNDTNTARFYSQFGLVPEAQEVWKKRANFEDALTKTLVAKDDAEFERLWTAFLTSAENDGFNEAMRQKIDEAFREANAPFMANITN